MPFRFFELSFDNFQGDCISCDICIPVDSVSSFYCKSESELTDLDYDYFIEFLFRQYRPDDLFVALIPIIDSSYKKSNSISCYEFFTYPKSWY